MTNVLQAELQRIQLRQPQGVIEGYMALWGSPQERDAYQTYFDVNRPPEMGLEFLPLPLLYEHGRDPVVGKTIIGKVTEFWADSDGVGFRAILDADGPFFHKILREIQEDRLGVSTGSAEHLAEFDTQGRFVTWILSEVSLTAAPAEPRMPAVALVRSRSPAEARGARTAPADAGSVEAPVSSDVYPGQSAGPIQRGDNMDIGQIIADLVAQGATPEQFIQALLAAGVAFDDLAMIIEQMQPPAESSPEVEARTEDEENPSTPPVSRRRKPKANGFDLATFSAALQQAQKQRQEQEQREQMRALQQQIEALQRQVQTTPAMPATQRPVGSNNPPPPPSVRAADLRFYHLSARDMLAGWRIRKSLPQYCNDNYAIPVSNDYLRALALKLLRDSEAGQGYATDIMVTRALPFRANEIMQTDLAGAGDEWVGIAYDTAIWESARIAPIWQQLVNRGMGEIEIPQGMESIYLLPEGSDPTVYLVPQTTDMTSAGIPDARLPASHPSTDRRLLTTRKFGVTVPWSGEMEEDSLIPLLPELRRKMDKAVQEAIEYILINGDTATAPNTNINLIDGTPPDQALYLGADGFLKLALVTTPTNSRDGGVFSDDDFRLLLSLLGNDGALAYDRQALLFLLDNATHDAAIGIPAFKTQDVFSNATIENGVLENVFGVDVLISGQMTRANSAGKISATPANNIKGRVLLVRPDQWRVGWKRHVTTEIQRWSYADVTQIVTHFRFGIAYQNAEAAAVSYNLTIA